MTKFWVGCSGWQYDEWQEKFYPVGLPKTQWFNYYCEHFNTVEINSSFYHFPSKQTIEKWRDHSPKAFKFSLKMNRSVTHYSRFNNTENMIENFYDLADRLEEKLGCILFQLPPSMHYDIELLDKIFEQLDTTKNNVIEFRHPSWWQDQVFNYFRNHKLIFCSVSAPKLPNDVITTHSSYYGRFHGSKQWFQGNYSKATLKKFSNQIADGKFKEIWAYFNNDIGAHAPKNATQLKELIKL